MEDEEKKEPDVYTKYNLYKPIECGKKKHPCKDCFSCLFCSEKRCKVCRASKCLKNKD